MVGLSCSFFDRSLSKTGLQLSALSFMNGHWVCRHISSSSQISTTGYCGRQLNNCFTEICISDVVPQPEVNFADLYQQIIENTVDEMEMVREAISNSVDAGATEISLTFDLRDPLDHALTFRDNGHGIIYENIGEENEKNGISAFWSLAKSVKLNNAVIGEKGLGSKTYLRATRVALRSNFQDFGLVSYMDEPIQTIQEGALPEYYPEDPVVPTHDDIDGTGTVVELTGLRFTNLNLNQDADAIMGRIKDYILWKTAAGSFKNKFNHYGYLRDHIPNLNCVPDVKIEIIGPGNEDITRTEFLGLHQWADDNPNPGDGDENHEGIRENSKKFSRSFQIHEQEGTPYQCYGSVLGEIPRSNLVVFRQGETHKSRFGLYLCKDFIPVMKYTDRNWMVNDSEFFYSCHVMLNCQSFKLDASRNNVTNLQTVEIQAVLDGFKRRFDQVASGYLTDYLDMRHEEKKLTKRRQTIRHLNELLDQYPDGQTELRGLNSIKNTPKNEYSTAMLFAALLEKEENAGRFGPIKAVAQHIDDATDIIALNMQDQPILVELEYKLTNLFRHGHPLDSYSAVVVWTIGDFEAGHEFETADGNIRLSGEERNWQLRWGNNRRPLVVLKEVLEDYQAALQEN